MLTDESQIGSIASGGRYDQLIGMFSNKQIPSLGISIGIERLFVIIEERFKNNPEILKEKTQVYVASVGKSLDKERLNIANALWKAGIKTEFLYESNPRPDKQMKKALAKEVPIMVWVGEQELANNQVKIKYLDSKEETLIQWEDLVTKIKEYFKH